MRILYVHQYFKTPLEGGSIRSYYLAKGLVDAGHEVTMLTTWKGPYTEKCIDGIEVKYLPVSYDNSFGFAKRIWSFLKFVRLAKREARKHGTFDLAYVMTTPLTTGFIARYVKEQLSIPYYFEVGDLWPEAPIQMGVIQNGFLKRWLYRLEKKCYDGAEKIIALSPDIRNYIERVSPNKKVYVIPNLSDCEFFEPTYSLGDYSKHNPFTVTYAGAMGKANNLEFLLEAAQSAWNEKLPVKFNIIGYGSEQERLKKAGGQLPNVRFHAHGSKEAVKELFAKSDAVYISFKDVQVLSTGSPNKFFDSLAAGKLTIINFEGWIKQVVERNKCGFYHNPQRPEDFIRKLKVFLRAPELLNQYQRKGRKLAEIYYDKNIQVTKLLKIMDNEQKFEVNEAEVYILTA